MTKLNSIHLLQIETNSKNVIWEKPVATVTENGGFWRENLKLLSRIPANPTVDSLRDKKESCSTQRGLRVGTGFMEFPQTP